MICALAALLALLAGEMAARVRPEAAVRFQAFLAESFDSVFVALLAAIEAKSSDPLKIAEHVVSVTNDPGTPYTFEQLDKAITDYDEAIQIANQTRYGLTASIYTRDLQTALRFARDVEAGYVWINDNQTHFLGAPYGGIKDSGLGREEELGEATSYTQLKNVNVFIK